MNRPLHVTIKVFVFFRTQQATFFIQARGSLHTNIYVYIYSYCYISYLWCSQHFVTTVLKCVWLMYMCSITLEFEYLKQRFAINGALFSPKNNISWALLAMVFFYSLSYSQHMVKSLNHVRDILNSEFLSFWTGLLWCHANRNLTFWWQQQRFPDHWQLHSFARSFLRTVPVMFPDGLSRGRSTCLGGGGGVIKNTILSNNLMNKRLEDSLSSKLTSSLLDRPILVMSIVK